jgi:hypothetical protein
MSAACSGPRAGRRTELSHEYRGRAAGFAPSAASGCPWRVASTLVVIPQSGHGTPVSVRSGQGTPA